MTRPPKKTTDLAPRYRRRKLRQLVGAAILLQPPPDLAGLYVLEVLRASGLPVADWLEVLQICEDMFGAMISRHAAWAIKKTLDEIPQISAKWANASGEKS